MVDLVPLIDRQMHERLDTLRAGMRAARIGEVARVFVPVGAEPNASAQSPAPRMLFVGRAARDWTSYSLATFDGSARGALATVKEYLPNGGTPIWQFWGAILRQTLAALGIEPSHGELHGFSGWSNLAKVAERWANPRYEFVEIQKHLCVEALRAEIALFRPTAVVVTTGNYAQQQILEPVFGVDGWHFDTPEGDRVAYRFHDGLKTLVVWTNYPLGRGMRPGERAIAQKLAVKLIVGAMQGRELPPGAIQSTS